MKLKSRNSGISLISLIITIIVIIILAAIVIFSGMGTPEKAQLSKVISDIDSVQTAVDQAYYGLYTEKAVAGEVWTKSQFYEAVATGETVRENLTSEGIVEISNDGLVGINLPKYEGRNWGVAVEDIDETTKVGSVVLLPGFDSDGKIYSTLLDVQNGGRDTALSTGIKTDIKVSNLKITTDEAGNTLAGTDVTDGTELYINFTASEGEETATISPAVPYKVTTNGSYEFTLTTSKGSKKYTVQVSNYKEITLADTLQVGDYIEYSGDINNSYTLNPALTGYTDTTKLEPLPNVSWRVWEIKDDGTVVIMPTSPVNSFWLGGSAGFVNSVDIINDVCKMYANEAYGVSAEDIRSLTIEDLEEVSTNLTTIRDNYNKDDSNYPQYGETNVQYYGTKKGNTSYEGYTSGTFYTESDGKTIKNGGITASSTNPVVLKQTYYYTNNPTWKSIGNSKFSILTYGSLLGGSYSWLASPCVDLGSSGAGFDVRRADSSIVGARYLCYSNGASYSYGYGVRPLVSLSSKLPIDTRDTSRDGSTAEKAWQIKLKE